MPVFANQPAACVLDSGEVAVLLTEPAQRSLGPSSYFDPLDQESRLFISHDTPRRREMLSWLLVMGRQETPTEPAVTPVFLLEKDADRQAVPRRLHHLRHAQGLEFTYCPKTKEFHVQFYWNLYTPVKQGPPQDYQEHITQTFLSTYKHLPISWALPLGPYEPHGTLLLAPLPQSPFLVGDPPLDPGGAWPGVYNNFDPGKTLLVGASDPHKNFDPYQDSDAHQSLPGTPGFVVHDTVQKTGVLINLGSVESFLNDHTQHLYHQREVQASRMATRVLMSARGRIQNLILEEVPPERDDPQTNFQGLTIGASTLTPGVKDEAYVGLNSVHIESSEALYPFGVSIPGFAVSQPGDVGHQFHASGGSGVYEWCLRRTRSSFGDTARKPQIPGVPSDLIPYPFDDGGDLLEDDHGHFLPFPMATQGGGMPPGMLFDRGGLFYGTPTQAGVYLFRLHVKDGNGLRGETTIRFEVLSDGLQVPQCTQGRGQFPDVYKASISYVDIFPLGVPGSIDSWRGRVAAIGGESQSYFFTLPNKSDPPRQQTPTVAGVPILEMDPLSGLLSIRGLTPDNFPAYQGVWVFEVRVGESMPKGAVAEPTCDTRGVAISIGTTVVAGMDDSLLTVTPEGKLPEGRFSTRSPVRPYLVLEMPTVVAGFPQGKNTYLTGSSPSSLRPDLGGLHFDTGLVTSVNPGFANPVQVIGIREDSLSPAHVYGNWLNSNPATFFRDTYDRFDPVPVNPAPPAPPAPPGSPPPISGGEIDDFIPVGKRIRPLWPV